ncbi:MAG: RND transporter, partial [Myxococcales bacterium]
PILAQMGLVAAGAVLAAVLLSVTLTPALLGLLGHRVMARRTWRHVVSRRDEDKAGNGFARRYVAFVTRKPWLTVLAVVAVLGVMSVPVTDLRLGLPDGSSDEPGSQGLTAYTTVAEEFGPGMNGPLLVSATRSESNADPVIKTQSGLMRDLQAVPGVEAVVPVGVSKDESTLAFQVVLDSGPTEESTTRTVHALMDRAEGMGIRHDAAIGMTGQTVANIEVSERLSDALPGYLAVVVGLSLIILLMVFRSVVVPLIATGGFLLSVGAAFGATVAVYQWGWLGDLLGVHTPGPIMSFGPILLIGVLFGLAMDYQMFLVSGMHEAHAHGERPRSAVRIGFVQGALVVTAAAAIMFAVFGGFVFSHMVMIRPIGFGLAVGVLVDAVLVRMTLMPALMHLLGHRAWTLPKWLDRILPDLDVEGRALTEQRAATADQERVPVTV